MTKPKTTAGGRERIKEHKHILNERNNRCKICNKHLKHSIACSIANKCFCDLDKPLYNL